MGASKILPYIMKYTCDPFKTVRDSAFKCIEIGLQRLKQHALTLPDKPVETVAPVNANGNAPTKSADASYLSTWASKITNGYSDSTNTTNSSTQRNSNNAAQSNGNNSKAVNKQKEESTDEWKPK